MTTRNCRISIALLPSSCTSIYHTRRGSFKGGLGGILCRVRERRIWASLPVLCLLLPVLVAAQGERPQTLPGAPAASRATVTLEGREIPVPVTINPSGPMFGLSPLVDVLGGTLTSDEESESVTLRLAEKDVVLGRGNAIVTVGDSIVSVSQPPARGDGGLQVPLDFLRKTYC